MLHQVSPYSSTAIVSESRTDVSANKPPLFLPSSQAPIADHVSIPHSLHRLKCIPGARERRAELLPAMRTGTAGWVGWGSSPKGPPDLPSLFIHRNVLLGAPPPQGLGPSFAQGAARPHGMPPALPPERGRTAPYLGPLVPRRGSPRAGRQKGNKCESAWWPGPARRQRLGRRRARDISPHQTSTA